MQRSLSREAVGDRQPPKRSYGTTIRPLRAPPRLPAFVFREAVERVNDKRNGLRMIAIHLKTGRHAACAAERSAWVTEASDAPSAAGNDRDMAEKQVLVMVDDMPTGVAPRAAWS